MRDKAETGAILKELVPKVNHFKLLLHYYYLKTQQSRKTIDRLGLARCNLFVSFSFFSFFLQVCIDMVSLGRNSITKLESVEDVHGIGRLWRGFQCWKAQTSVHHLAT
jgi:hypothetical protein